MKKETNLCMSCMRELDKNGLCPVCGSYDTNSYVSSYLAPKTFLHGRYIVGKLIDYCGESALYIGFDTELKKKVTVREYMPDTLCVREKDQDSVTVKPDKLPLYKTYLAEFAELHSTLMRSSNIHCVQTVLDVFSENNTAYAVMDYIGGISLKAYLANCGEVLSWEQVKELFPPILTALGMLHSLGIIHRGISPSTIFVSEKNELRLTGFSISAARTSDSDIGYEVFGGYAPPEQYSSTRRNGSWTDVYGISALLYRCLTGITPPTASERLTDDSLVEPLLINRNIPKNVSDVIVKGMALESDNRISTVNEFVDRLFEQPSPAADASGEIPIPDTKGSQGKTGHNGSKSDGDYERAVRVSKSESAKAKKQIKRDKIKFILVTSVLGIILIGFLVAMIIASSSGSDEGDPSSTQAVTTTALTTQNKPAPEESQAPSSTAASSANAGETYLLPNFKNTVFASVSTNSRYSYLIFNPTYKFDDEVKAGEIIDQTIEPGTPVTTGTEIGVTVSKGPEKVKLPEYKDLKAEDYIKQLTELGIKYRTEEEETAEVEPGLVSKCNKEVGDDVSLADSEEIVVYIAKKPPETTVPETTPPVTTVPETTAAQIEPPAEETREETVPADPLITLPR
ncbi:MAG: PASTA domain-containing protein [Ruminiclostridium sp.]|nr:PASTA domain-containing protein [Ruminiclostridium sp.]